MRKSRVFLAMLVIGAVAQVASAQVSIGGAQSLYIQPGARPSGMGDSFVAVADDASAIWWNPAGLGYLGAKHSFTLMHTELVPDWGDVYYEYVAYAQRVEGLGTIGASIIYLTYGEQQATAPESPDIIGKFSSYEIIPSIAYGTTIGENLSLGLNLKFVYVRLAPGWATTEGQEGVGSTFAADFGAIYKLMHGRLALGGAIQHVGPRIAYIDEEQADPLPRNLRLGFGWTVLKDDSNRLLLVGDYNKSLVIYEDIADITTGVILNTGAEYEYANLFALRLGYVYDEDGAIKGVAYGMGLKYKSWAFDVASVPQAEGLKRPFRFSLAASF
jgi:hypothetical protein